MSNDLAIGLFIALLVVIAFGGGIGYVGTKIDCKHYGGDSFSLERVVTSYSSEKNPFNETITLKEVASYYYVCDYDGKKFFSTLGEWKEVEEFQHNREEDEE